MRAVANISEPSPSAVDAAEGRTPRSDLAPGQVIAKRYRLDRELGRGGMGVVWAATHLVTLRGVAIKFLLGSGDPRAELRRRFLREARAASAVDHPNVVQVIDVFELDDETPVIVMELLSGKTLREKLERDGRLPFAHAKALLLPVISAVATAHGLGIVHRDLKPENIFLAQSGSRGETVKVLDFGIAKLVSLDRTGETESITGTGSTLGTPCYMAPEQTLGEKDIDHRADIWALGVIFYECLAGVRPIQGSGIGQIVMNLATEGIKPLDQVVPGLPPEATALVMRMLQRDRSARPQDLHEVEEALSGIVTSVPVFTPTAVSPVMPIEDRARRALFQAPVDTNGAQSVPRRARPRAGRVWLGVAAGGVLVTALAGWRLTSPAPGPSGARPPAEGVTGLVTPPAQVSAAAVVSEVPVSLAAPMVSKEEASAVPSSPGALTTPRRAKGHVPAASASINPVAPSASAAVAVPVATAKPPPGGLAEKPPF